MGKKDILQFVVVKEFLKSVGGEESELLVKYCLKKRRNITDEYLAKKMGLKVTEIRTILNRLHYLGISNYSKTKNQKTGWYSYTWEINPHRMALLILKEQTEEVQKLERTQQFEKDYMFFGCKKPHELLPFEIAAEYEFKCPECGKALEAIDNNKRLKEIQKRIVRLRREISELKKTT